MKKNSGKPGKITIKSELDREIYPMSHYVDDRVELIKEMFGALKAKTIKSLAPDFLRDSSVEDIEELCLNEILGISQKRLLSIINATKCPSDTESSGDSDVENIEEHISLEEISSESESEKQKPKKKKKTPQDKEISVLELLELQARARAIRSQLALEPIAKVEVDSDESSDEKTGDKNKPKQKESGSKTVQNGVAATTSKDKDKKKERVKEKEKEKAKEPVKIHESESKPKRVKLKRNFRKRSINEDDKNDATKAVKVESTSKEDPKTQEIPERSPSPDVITILPSPETLCISDSSDEEAGPSGEKNPVDEKASEKESTGNVVVNKEIEVSTDKTDKNVDEEKTEITVEPNKTPEEVEDGEIEDNDEGEEEEEESNMDKNDSTKKTSDDASDKPKGEDQIHDDILEIHADDDKPKGSPVEPSHRCDDTISLGHDDLDLEMRDQFDLTDATQNPSTTGSQEEAGDVSIEEKNNDSNENQLEHEEIIDFIDLNNSSDDEEPSPSADNTKNETQSWNHRWLTSSKVKQILATSRIGNRVRDKIKRSKKTKQQTSADESSASNTGNNTPIVFSSAFEDGSVQQYEEIASAEKNKSS